MITYFIVGIIVQLVIIAERTFRFHDVWTDESVKHWDFWISLIGYFIINVLLWPLAIVCEIVAIYYGF